MIFFYHSESVQPDFKFTTEQFFSFICSNSVPEIVRVLKCLTHFLKEVLKLSTHHMKRRNERYMKTVSKMSRCWALQNFSYDGFQHPGQESRCSEVLHKKPDQGTAAATPWT